MTRSRKTFVFLTVCVAAAFITGCSSDPKITTPPPPPKPDIPDWINDPEGAFPGDKGKVLYQVGMSGTVINPQMARERSEENGRAKLARAIEAQVQTMIKDWMAEAVDYVNSDTNSSKQFTESVSRSVADVTLVGSKGVKYWPDLPETGKPYYCLMSLARDDEFFKAIKEQAEKEMKKDEAKEKEKVLKVRMEDAIKSLDEYLEKEAAKTE